jgi:hypothetical protein
VLNSVFRVDWRSLNVPMMAELVKGLLSDDIIIQRYASGKLREYLGEHDFALNITSTYQDLLQTDAIEKLVPILLALLKPEYSTQKALVFPCLSILCSYRMIKDLLPAAMDRANRIYDFLLVEFDSFTPFLYSNDSSVRQEVIQLMSYFIDTKAETVELLLNVSENVYNLAEGEQLICASTLSEYFERQESKFNNLSSIRFMDVLRKWLNDDSSYLSVKSYSALYLLKLISPSFEYEIAKLLVNIYKLPEHKNKSGYLYPALMEFTDILLLIGIRETTDFLLEIFDNQTSIQAMLKTLTILLSIHFGADDFHEIRLYHDTYTNRYMIHNNTTIDPHKKHNSMYKNILINSIVNKNKLWEVDIKSLLEAFDLPGSKEELESMIGLR